MAADVTEHGQVADLGGRVDKLSDGWRGKDEKESRMTY